MAENEALIERLRGLIGSRSAREFARITGVKQSTLQSVLTGTRPGIDFMMAVAKGHAVSIDWLCGVDGAAKRLGSQINEHYLEAAIDLVEDWLEAENRIMLPKKKAAVVTQIYQFIMDDAAEGHNPLDRSRVQRILRLVA